MSVTIKAGGFYVTRGGRKVGPMLANDSRKYDPRFKWYSHDNGFPASPAWTGNGSFFLDVDFSDDDIVAEWVEPSPVRQVTRQEIVPGTYARINVQAPASGSEAEVSIYPTDRDGRWSPLDSRTVMNADELRAAARVFISLAEALEQEP